MQKKTVIGGLGLDGLGLLCVLAFGLLPTAASGQATINVPRDRPTIQAAIGVANDGDTVLVAPGIYVENIDFNGKQITVTSSQGAARTIIDGGAKGPTVTFQSNETNKAVLSGMTVRNAGGFGVNLSVAGIAGVLVNNASPTIVNNTITQNPCFDIEILFGGPVIAANTISSTVSPVGGCGDGSGAGIYVGGNMDGNAGSGAATLVGNTIENVTIPAPNVPPGSTNLDNNGGAGIAIFGGGPLIQNNILRNNSAPGGNGGAINVAGGVGVTIEQNLIYGNSAGCGGGAISFTDSYGGEGLYLLIASNTMVDNTGGSSNVYASCGDASQIYGSDYGLSSQNVVIVNNIISSSTASAPAVGCFEVLTSPDEFEQSIFDHNVLYNGGASVFGTTCVDVSAKDGNVGVAPQFVDAVGGNYRLMAGSVGIDTGNNSALQLISQLSGTELTADRDGNSRVQDATGAGYPVIDMGAYEFPGKVDGTPTAVVLTAPTYSAAPGDLLALTATLTSALGVPTGNAAFFVDGKQIGVAPIAADGTAYLSTFFPAAGTHSVYAMYAGQGSFTPAESVIILIDSVEPPMSDMYATTLTITANFNPQLYGQDVTLTIQVSSADPNKAFVPLPITLTLNRDTVIAVLVPDKTGSARYTTNTLPAGFPLITADYAGDATHQAATANLTESVQGIGTRMVIACTPTGISIGQTSVFTAQVISETGDTPTGRILFTDNGAVLGRLALLDGEASLTYYGRTRGVHHIEGLFEGTGAFNGAGPISCGSVAPEPIAVTVFGVPSTSVLNVVPASAPYQTVRTMTVTVSPTTPPGLGVPTGKVDFLNGADLLGTAVLVDGIATFTTVALPAGADSVTCAYEGDLTYDPSNCSAVPVTTSLAQPTLTLTASADDIPALTPVTFNVQLLVGGKPPIDSLFMTLTVDGKSYPLPLSVAGKAGAVVSTLLPGKYLVTANFAGTANLLSATTSLTETVITGDSTTVVSASPSPGYVAQPITISAMVTVADALVPQGGVVTFYDGTTVLGTGMLDQTRTATLTTSSLAVGMHPLTASYPATGPFTASTSPVFIETVLNGVAPVPTFTISLSPMTVTLPPGQSATAAIQLASVGGFAGPLTLSYGTLPMNISASIVPGSVTLAAGGNGTATFTLNAAAQAAAQAAVAHSLPERIRGAGTTGLLAAALLLLIPRRRRLSRLAGPRGVRLVVWVLVGAGMMQMLSGCGNSFYISSGSGTGSGSGPGSGSGTAPGTYQIPVTATDSNEKQQTAVLTLVVPSP